MHFKAGVRTPKKTFSFRWESYICNKKYNRLKHGLLNRPWSFLCVSKLASMCYMERNTFTCWAAHSQRKKIQQYIQARFDTNPKLYEEPITIWMMTRVFCGFWLCWSSWRSMEYSFDMKWWHVSKETERWIYLAVMQTEYSTRHWK